MDELHPIPDELRALYRADQRHATIDPGAKLRALQNLLSKMEAASLPSAERNEPNITTENTSSAEPPALGESSWIAATMNAGKIALLLASGYAAGRWHAQQVLESTRNPTEVAAPSPMLEQSAQATDAGTQLPTTTTATPPAQEIVQQARAIPRRAATVEPAPTDVIPETTASTDVAENTPTSEPIVPPSPVSALTSERALVDATRIALLRRDYSAALGTLREMDVRFPNGIFTEERDRMRIEALVRSGNGDAARRAIDTFRQRYARGANRDAVERMARELDTVRSVF